MSRMARLVEDSDCDGEGCGSCRGTERNVERLQRGRLFSFDPLCLYVQHRSTTAGKIDKCLAALQVALDSGSGPTLQAAYTALGQAYHQEHRYAEALQCFERLLECISAQKALSHTPQKETYAEGVVCCRIGLIAIQVGDYEKALLHLERHLAIAKVNQDTVAQGVAYSNLSVAYEKLGAMEKALDCHWQSLELSLAAGAVAQQCTAYTALGRLYHSLGDPDQTASCFEKALAIAVARGDTEMEVTACAHLREAHRLLGNGDKALEYAQAELAAAQRAGAMGAVLRAHKGLAELYEARGDYDRALPYYRSLVQAADEGLAGVQSTAAYQGLGLTYCAQAKHKDAHRYLKKALTAAQDAGDVAGQRAAHLALGRVHYNAGSFRAALERYAAVLRLPGEGSSGQRAEAHTGIGAAHARLDDYSAATQSYRAAATEAALAAQPELECGAYQGLAAACHRQDAGADALAWQRRALAVAEQAGHGGLQLKACLGAGHVLVGQGNADEALEFYQRALRLAEGRRDGAGEWRAYVGIGTCWYALHEMAKAGPCYIAALQIVGELRDKAPAPALVGEGDGLLVDILEALLRHPPLSPGDPPAQEATLQVLTLLVRLLECRAHAAVLALPPAATATFVGLLTATTGHAALSSAYAEHARYQCVAGLQELSRSLELRSGLCRPPVINACLACLAESSNATVGLEVQFRVTEFIRSLLTLVPGGALIRVLWGSRCLPRLLPLLPADADGAAAKAPQATNLLSFFGALLPVTPVVLAPLEERAVQGVLGAVLRLLHGLVYRGPEAGPRAEVLEACLVLLLALPEARKQAVRRHADVAAVEQYVDVCEDQDDLVALGGEFCRAFAPASGAPDCAITIAVEHVPSDGHGTLSHPLTLGESHASTTSGDEDSIYESFESGLCYTDSPSSPSSADGDKKPTPRAHFGRNADVASQEH